VHIGAFSAQRYNKKCTYASEWCNFIKNNRFKIYFFRVSAFVDTIKKIRYTPVYLIHDEKLFA
jgi:hypothetical protein